jgi:hypothetical protein
MTDVTVRASTPFEKAAAMREAGFDVPPHPKAGASGGMYADSSQVPAETFLMQCEAWKLAVEEAHRIWKPDGQ